MDTKNNSSTDVQEQPIEAVENIKITEEPRFYELSYLIKPGLEEAQVLGVAEKLRSVISDLKGMIVEESHPKSIRLSYKINKQTEGFSWGWVKLLLKHEQLNTLRNNIGKIKEIERIRLFKADKAVDKRQTAPKKPRKIKEERGEDKEIDKKLEELLG